MRTDSSSDDEIKGLYNCSYFRLDYNSGRIGRCFCEKFLFLIFIINNYRCYGIVSIFIGISVYNSQKEYHPPLSYNLNVDINNNRVINNRVDLSSESLKRNNT